MDKLKSIGGSLLGPTGTVAPGFDFGLVNLTVQMVLQAFTQVNPLAPLRGLPLAEVPARQAATPPLGMSPFPLQASSGGFGPTLNACPDRGAGYTYPAMAHLRQLSQKMGSLDGTPITANSTWKQDRLHSVALGVLKRQAGARLQGELGKADERSLTAWEANERALQQYAQRHPQIPAGQLEMLRALGLDMMAEQGELRGSMAQASRDYLELLDYANRSQANYDLKYGQPPNPDVPAQNYAESPFNPERQPPPPEPAQAQPPAHLNQNQAARPKKKAKSKSTPEARAKARAKVKKKPAAQKARKQKPTYPKGTTVKVTKGKDKDGNPTRSTEVKDKKGNSQKTTDTRHKNGDRQQVTESKNKDGSEQKVERKREKSTGKETTKVDTKTKDGKTATEESVKQKQKDGTTKTVKKRTDSDKNESESTTIRQKNGDERTEIRSKDKDGKVTNTVQTRVKDKKGNESFRSDSKTDDGKTSTEERVQTKEKAGTVRIRHSKKDFDGGTSESNTVRDRQGNETTESRSQDKKGVVTTGKQTRQTDSTGKTTLRTETSDTKGNRQVAVTLRDSKGNEQTRVDTVQDGKTSVTNQSRKVQDDGGEIVESVTTDSTNKRSSTKIVTDKDGKSTTDVTVSDPRNKLEISSQKIEEADGRETTSSTTTERGRVTILSSTKESDGRESTRVEVSNPDGTKEKVTQEKSADGRTVTSQQKIDQDGVTHTSTETKEKDGSTVTVTETRDQKGVVTETKTNTATAEENKAREEEKKPQKVEKPPFDARKDATSLNKALNAGFLSSLGLSTDEDLIYNTLRNKTPDQIEEIRKQYAEENPGRNLDDDLRSKLSSTEMARVDALIKGDLAAADAVAIEQSFGNLGTYWTDDKAIREALSNKSPEEREKIIQAYEKRTGRALRDDLKANTHTNATEDEALALLDGNQAKADAARLLGTRDYVFYADKSAMEEVLRNKSQSERDAIAVEFARAYGSKSARLQPGKLLEQELGKNFSGADLVQANALLNGNTALADAAAIKSASQEFWGANDTTMNRYLDGKSDEERNSIKKAYKEQFGIELKDDLKNSLSGNYLERTTTLLENGKQTSAQILKFSVEGAGTDEDGIKKALAGKSKAEIGQIREDYRKLTGRELDADLEGDLGGRELFDAKQDLKGVPETPEEWAQRAKDYREFERGESSNWLTNINLISPFLAMPTGLKFSTQDALDLIYSEGGKLDRTTSQVDASLKRYQQLKAEGKLDEANAEARNIKKLNSYLDQDVQNYREVRDTAADVAGTVAATVAGVAVVIATLGTGAPLIAVVAGAALAGGVARVATSAVIKGGGYGLEDAAIDFGKGTIDGGTALIGGGGSATAMVTRKGVELAARQTLLQAGKISAKNTLTVAEKRLVSGLTQRMLTGVTSNAGKWGNNPLLRELGQEALGGALGNFGTTLLEDKTWKNGFYRGLGSAAYSGATGAVMGAGIAAAFMPVGWAWSRWGSFGRSVDEVIPDAPSPTLKVRMAPMDVSRQLPPVPERKLLTGGKEPKLLTAGNPADELAESVKAKPVKADELIEPTPPKLLNEGKEPRLLTEDKPNRLADPNGGPDWTLTEIDGVKVKSRDIQDGNGIWWREVDEGTGPVRSLRDEASAWVEKVDVDGKTFKQRALRSDDGKGDWLEFDHGNYTVRRRTVKADDNGAPWSEIQGDSGVIIRQRPVAAQDGKGDWLAVQEGNGPIRQSRTIQAEDGGPDWFQTRFSDGPTQSSRQIQADDGGPDWSQVIGSDGISKSYRRSAPDLDGLGPWNESMVDGVLSRNRTYHDPLSGELWAESVLGQNRWRYRAGGMDGLAEEALTRGSSTLQVDGMAIRVHGGATPQELANIQQALQQMPPDARQFASDIYLNENLGQILSPDGLPLTGVGGMAGDGRMVLDRKELSNLASSRRLIYHEAGHNADNAVGATNKPPWGRTGTSVSQYGQTNAMEDYAETHRVVLQNWERYQSMTPAQWARESEAQKKMEIARRYGAQVPEAEAVEAASHFLNRWRRQKMELRDSLDPG